jgi:hypothetical protein
MQEVDAAQKQSGLYRNMRLWQYSDMAATENEWERWLERRSWYPVVSFSSSATKGGCVEPQNPSRKWRRKLASRVALNDFVLRMRANALGKW